MEQPKQKRPRKPAGPILISKRPLGWKEKENPLERLKRLSDAR
jgi:hypothetical protein